MNLDGVIIEIFIMGLSKIGWYFGKVLDMVM